MRRAVDLGGQPVGVLFLLPCRLSGLATRTFTCYLASPLILVFKTETLVAWAALEFAID